MSEDPWKHRSAGMRCTTCIWFVPKTPVPAIQFVAQTPVPAGQASFTPTPPGRSDVGRCRRHAPTINGYPVVFMTDWCGDHRLDENKA